MLNAGASVSPMGVAWLLAITVLLALLSLLVGVGEVGPRASLAYLLALDPGGGEVAFVVDSLRAPRAVAAVLVGTGLGIAGALMQAITRNPLAEPGLLGVNAGAALAVVVGITYFGVETGAGYLFWAFVGALGGSVAVIVVARAGDVAASPLRLVLAGVALGATFQGLTAWLLLAHQFSFDQYRFWILGSLAGMEFESVLAILPAVAAGLLVALGGSQPLAALMLGDDTARSLGHRPSLIRAALVGAVALLAGAAVALAGPIAFLGLLAPHAARPFAGMNLGLHMTLSALTGTAILLAADVGARLVVRPFETPASLIVALIGGPVLVWVVRSNRLLEFGAGERRS